MPSVSIVIPTCNRCEDLRRCLNALMPQLPSDGSAEVRVCDDGSSDETRRMLAMEFPTVHWNQGPKRGPAGNRNFGAKISNSEWLIFIDDDCIPRSSYLESYLTAFRSTEGRLFHGLTFPKPPLHSMYYEAPEITSRLKVFASCNFAIRKELFEKSGGFDERYFPSFEDIEYFARLDRLGADARCVEGAAVDHPIRRIPNARKLAKRWEARVVSVTDLGASPIQVAILLPKHVLLVILSRFRGAKLTLENVKATLVFIAEFLYFLYFLPGWIRKHAREPRSRFWVEQVALGKAPQRFGL